MRKVGIDLGTTNLLICVDNEGIVIDEPSILTAQHDLHQSAEGRGHRRF